MEVTIRRINDVVIFDFYGKIIGNDGIKMRRHVGEHILTAARPRFLFNLAHVSRIDATGLGALVEAHVRAKGKGGRVGLINVSRHIRNLLSITKLDTVLEQLDSEAKAITSLSSAEKRKAKPAFPTYPAGAWTNRNHGTGSESSSWPAMAVVTHSDRRRIDESQDS
jgi:anti-sigma B factor antagonist